MDGGLDRIKVYSQHPPAENWQADGDGWVLSIEGSYCTLNTRDSLGDDCCPILTLTTPTKWDSDLCELTPADFVRVYDMLPKDRHRIEYLWQGRIVRASYPCQPDGYIQTEPWVDYSLDYWDNCVDADYLLYLNTIPMGRLFTGL